MFEKTSLFGRSLEYTQLNDCDICRSIHRDTGPGKVVTSLALAALAGFVGYYIIYIGLGVSSGFISFTLGFFGVITKSDDRMDAAFVLFLAGITGVITYFFLSGISAPILAFGVSALYFLYSNTTPNPRAPLLTEKPARKLTEIEKRHQKYLREVEKEKQIHAAEKIRKAKLGAKIQEEFERRKTERVPKMQKLQKEIETEKAKQIKLESLIQTKKESLASIKKTGSSDRTVDLEISSLNRAKDRLFFQIMKKERQLMSFQFEASTDSSMLKFKETIEAAKYFFPNDISPTEETCA